MTTDLIATWSERIREAAAEGSTLCLRGGGSKDFCGRPAAGEVLDTRACSGVVGYEPSELVVTLRAGTLLADVEALLDENGQMLAFEPPRFASGGTVGGCVAAGLAGPRRQAAGGVRDFVLGARMLDGRGELLHFGGEVMKNVAGYDLSRVLAGSFGTLGLIVEVSLKVLPRPRAEASLRFSMDEETALDRLNAWAGRPLPISASAWRDGVLDVRLSGALAAVDAAAARLGGEALAADEAQALWSGLRDQRDAYFDGTRPLWRLSLPSDAPPAGLADATLIEWGGAQRWLRSERAANEIRARAAELGGHATLFRHGERRGAVFHPLPAAMLALQRRLKTAFDPAGVFNPGRMVEGI